MVEGQCCVVKIFSDVFVFFHQLTVLLGYLLFFITNSQCSHFIVQSDPTLDFLCRGLSEITSNIVPTITRPRRNKYVYYLPFLRKFLNAQGIS